jgi:glycerate dehydrogenase
MTQTTQGMTVRAIWYNVILTPHIAWGPDEAQQTLADQLIDNIKQFVVGTPRNLLSGTC